MGGGGGGSIPSSDLKKLEEKAKQTLTTPAAGVRHLTPIFAPFRKVPSALARV